MTTCGRKRHGWTIWLKLWQTVKLSAAGIPVSHVVPLFEVRDGKMIHRRHLTGGMESEAATCLRTPEEASRRAKSDGNDLMLVNDILWEALQGVFYAQPILT